MREVEIVAAVDAAWRDQPHRRLMLLHVPDLHPGRMRAEQRGGGAHGRAHGRREIQRVLHVARGMVRRHVERFEVVVVVFELGPLDDEEPHAAEDGFDASRSSVKRMTMAERGRRPGSVTSTAPAGGRDASAAAAMRSSSAGFDLLLEIVGELAEERTRVGRVPSPSAFSSAGHAVRLCARDSDRARHGAPPRWWLPRDRARTRRGACLSGIQT